MYTKDDTRSSVIVLKCPPPANEGVQKVKDARLFIAGKWVEAPTQFPVLDKFSRREVARAHVADKSLVDRAVSAAKTAFQSEISILDRYNILSRAAVILERRREEIVDVMVTETGFTVSDNTGDLSRCIQTLQTSAEESKRLNGEIVPIDAAPGHAGEMAFTLRVPLGIVAAITPFNSPLNTVAHKVAPAIAAGNAVVLKPASYTPLTACLLAEVLDEAGLPGGWLNIVHGPGSRTGRYLCENPDIRFFAFTGGGPAGEAIQHAAGLRRTQMELGNISSTVVCEDANIEKASALVARAAFRKAGQVCVSVQRLFVQRAVVDVLTEQLVARAGQMKAGDPRDAAISVGPMIDIAEAERAEAWVREAVAGGAIILVGGTRNGSVFSPTVLANVRNGMKVLDEEIFAPVVSIIPFESFEEAVARVNDTPYGLSAGIFTKNIDRALRAARKVEVGLFNINNTSANRADLMPYGGCKASGFGREGPRAAIREMTEERLVTITPAE
jgi:acyl-CoA reductase-like NAD-dependent aldehyde dehydrogenase